MCNATITNMDTQVTSDSKVEVNPVMESNLNQNGEPGVMASTPDQVEPQLPVKKPTRQWAAWTHQEEESFFAALRQVGKNFEKITRRVQSKNKDQVRHYYYRLVRRMNKLLGPGLFLDAKNSKDTNAAMLRWWSLLEKYSCKASKLHLKPRRFKLFIEALENQLLKDRKKNVRRRPLQEENGSPTALGAITHQNRSGGHDTRTVKPVVEGSQNIQRVGAGRGSLKRNVNIGIIRSNHKGESTTMKPVRQRRKQGVLSSAAYKRWEKAAMAGVSLVADAAAHLERTVTDKEVEHNHHIGGENGHIPVDNVLPLRPLPFPSYMNSHPVEGILNPNTKLKLQLFPIDDGTRRALEMDKRNPYLELTLSTRKKISSVLEHLNRKWGDSCVASGELILFPYNVQRENILGYQRWTQDSTVNAVDVYILIGSPPVFRLRYGWFSNNELASLTCREPPESNHVPYQDSRGMACKEGKTMDLAKISVHPTNDNIGLPDDICMNQLSAENRGQSTAPQTDDYIDTTPGSILVKLSTSASNVPWHRKETCDEADMTDLEDPNDMRLGNGTTLSAGEWADSLTNISVGDLLSEVSNDENDNFIEPLTGLKDQCFQQIPFSCDSFDAAIAAHFAKHENKMAYESAVSSHSSSIFDAEETCDAFAFAKNRNLRNEVCAPSIASPRTSSPRARTGSMTSSAYEEVRVVEEQADCPASDPIGACSPNQQVENVSPKDFNGLPDISWPDSLGPLDLDIPSFKYHSEDLILSNSLGGLNRLIASSLDAFQNCSFFGLDKKD